MLFFILRGPLRVSQLLSSPSGAHSVRQNFIWFTNNFENRFTATMCPECCKLCAAALSQSIPRVAFVDISYADNERVTCIRKRLPAEEFAPRLASIWRETAQDPTLQIICFRTSERGYPGKQVIPPLIDPAHTSTRTYTIFSSAFEPQFVHSEESIISFKTGADAVALQRQMPVIKFKNQTQLGSLALSRRNNHMHR